jgi:large subunit ribosomal protein L30
MPGKKAAQTKRTPVKAYNRTEHDGKKSGGMVKIKWVVSFISCTDDMRQTIRGLGLRRMHQVVERQDTPAVRGMIHKVRHLVKVVE